MASRSRNRDLIEALREYFDGDEFKARKAFMAICGVKQTDTDLVVEYIRAEHPDLRDLDLTYHVTGRLVYKGMTVQLSTRRVPEHTKAVLNRRDGEITIRIDATLPNETKAESVAFLLKRMNLTKDVESLWC